jgi:hypothetical protein
MPSFRVNFFFSEFKQGWVESWYLDGTSLGAIEAQADLLAPLLVAPRTIHCSLDAFRIIQVDPPLPRKGLLDGFNEVGSRPDGVLLGSEAEDVTQTCAFFTAHCNDNTTRVVMLRGLADTDVIRGGAFGGGTPSPPVAGLFATLAAGLSLGRWEMRHYPVPPVGTPVTMIDADPANPQFTRITCAVAPGYAVGDKVHFTGVPLPTVPWLKGQWIVKAVVGATFSISYLYPLALPTHPTKMESFETTYVYTTFSAWTFRDFRSRKTGRPTGLTRGRATGIRFRR